MSIFSLLAVILLEDLFPYFLAVSAASLGAFLTVLFTKHSKTNDSQNTQSTDEPQTDSAVATVAQEPQPVDETITEDIQPTERPAREVVEPADEQSVEQTIEEVVVEEPVETIVEESAPADVQPILVEESTVEPVEQPVVEEQPIEQPVAEIVTEQPSEPENELDEGVMVIGGKEVVVRYKRSFLSKLMQSSDELKGYFAELVNHALSYKKVKSRISWQCAKLNCGREKIATILVRGRALYVYLAIDTELAHQTIKGKLKNVSDKKRYQDTPTLFKVKSPLSLRKAKVLLDTLMQAKGIEFSQTCDTISTQDYPYDTTENLIKAGLVQVRTLDGSVIEDGDILRTAGLSINKKSAPQPVEPTVEQALENLRPTEQPVEEIEIEPVEEPAEETATEPVEEVVEDVVDQHVDEPVVEEYIADEPADEPTEEVVEPVEEPTEEPTEEVVEPTAEPEVESDEGIMYIDENEVLVRYNRSFTSKLMQSSDLLKSHYAELINLALSYKKVKNRVSWPCSKLNWGRQNLVTFTVRGKSLYMYLALDPDARQITKGTIKDVSHKKRYQATPSMFKVRSPLSLRRAKVLLEALMQRKGVVLGNACTDYSQQNYPYDTTENLIKAGLIKVRTSDGAEVEEGMIMRAAGFGIVKSVTVEQAHEMISDEVASTLVQTTPVEECVERGNKKCIINIDTLSNNFNDGDTVTLKALKQKGLVTKNVGYVKVVARGMLDKSLTVQANAFSLDAVKMIVLVGGTAIKC